jgi:nucleoside-diphosphate-sugar epimerase
MVSTKAVYVDPSGRHTNSEVPPAFIGPIRESQPTVRPTTTADYRSREGYAPNKVAAEEILLDSMYPVTVLRPSKVHGAWSRQPREWVFVKRVLDRRPAVVLAKRGVGVDHPCAAANVAALVEVVATNPGKRILNSADPDAPSPLEISRAIAAYLGHTWEEVLLADGGPYGVVGRTPWDAVPPIVLDMSAAIALGYQPAGTYATCVAAEIDWLVAASRDAAIAWAIPAYDDSYFAALLDYAAEDHFLSSRAAKHG